jgi:uncharacterized protein DUF6916
MSVPASRTTMSMDQYTGDAFAPLVGQVFRFHRTAGADDPSIDLELLEVQSSPRPGGGEGRQPFSLLFELRSGDAPRETTLHLRHDQFEPCAWFVNRVMVPGRPAKTPYYEAVFG